MKESDTVNKKISDYLGMSKRPVGVTLLSEGEAAGAGGFETQKRMSFCRIVHDAAEGADFLIRKEDIACPSAETCLGMREPSHKDVDQRIKERIVALKVGPVEDADVVLMILNPGQMTTASLLIEGVPSGFTKNRVICGYATAQVCNSGKPHVTFLCTGSRTEGKFKTGELVLAMPYKVFLHLPSRMGRPAMAARAEEKPSNKTGD